jgi:molybdate transport system substrate-binding protein
MTTARARRPGLAALALLLALAAPPAAPRPAPAVAAARPGGEVTVFAAASLTDAFKEIADAFQADNSGTSVTFNFGGSNTLRAQLDQGAAADVFASADQAQMDLARQDGDLSGDPQVFAHNLLTIITPAGNPRQVQGVCDLARPGLKLVTSQPNVPVGQYTLAMLRKAGAGPCGAAFQDQVQANVVSRESDVRQLVAKVQLGEADAGVSYTTDVTPQVREQVQEVAIPDDLNTLATYPIALANGPNPEGGRAFVDYVLSPPAQDILARWGFLPITAAG